MTETIFRKHLFDVDISFLVWPMTHLLTQVGEGLIGFTAAGQQGAIRILN